MTPENRALALEWAKAQMPREACGLLIIEKGRERFIPCENISTIHDTFEISPIDFARAEDRGEIVGVFHSHCYKRAQPSEADLVACEQTGVPWTIVSVPNEEWHEFFPTGYQAPLVGRTWMHGVLDCYALVRDYYKRELMIEIPDFDREFEWWHKGQDLFLDNFKSAGFVEVTIPEIKQHDGLLMQISSPVVNHCGVYLGDDRMLHHVHRRLSGRDVFGGYWRKMTVKVVRHWKLL